MKISELPIEIKNKAIWYRSRTKYQKNKDSNLLEHAFYWNKTTEGTDFWNYWCEKKYTGFDFEIENTKKIKKTKESESKTIYKIANDRKWNPYLFDIVKSLEQNELDAALEIINLWKEESK